MNRWLKGIGYAVGGLVGVVLVSGAAVYGFSEARYRKQYAVTPRPVPIPSDSASLARGAHLVRSIAGCVDCHGENFGGKAVFDQPAFGRVYALNLTSGKGGVGGTLSDTDYVRAIRHGIAPTGRALKIMPSSEYMNLSDSDLGAIIAYLKSLPPVDNEVPAVTIGPIGRALMVAGKLPILEAESIDHERRNVPSVTPAATAGYGAYLASVGCKGCHGPTLAGGPILGGDPAWPPAANLTPAGSTKDWSEEDFKRALREGKRPGGIAINPAMPYRMYANLTDDEIHALFLYIRSLTPVPTAGVQTASH